jgi:GT2 family glycosyltransferase
MKVLIGTPMIDKKMYSWVEYVRAINKLTIPKDELDYIFGDDIIQVHKLIVDTSDKKDALRIDVVNAGFAYYHVTTGKAMDKVVLARNTIFDFAIDNKCDYVLFIDSDVIVPKETLTSLLSHNVDIASGFYPLMNEFGIPIPNAKVTSGVVQGYMIFPDMKLDGGIYPVDLVGMGCCLISKKIFEKYRFRCERGKYGDLIKSEDWCFCEDLKKDGVAIMFDTKLTCKHKIVGEHWKEGEA